MTPHATEASIFIWCLSDYCVEDTLQNIWLADPLMIYLLVLIRCEKAKTWLVIKRMRFLYILIFQSTKSSFENIRNLAEGFHSYCSWKYLADLLMIDLLMKIVINCFKSISLELLGHYGKDSLIVYDYSASYACQMLLPLYKVCEGYWKSCFRNYNWDNRWMAISVWKLRYISVRANNFLAPSKKPLISKLSKRELAHEVRESIRVIMWNHFIQVYNVVRKNERGTRGNKTRRSWL